MTSAHYGHIIKHLEVSHLNELPVPELAVQLLDEFSERVREILDYRDQAHKAALQAEAHFEKCLGAYRCTETGESGFTIASSIGPFSGQRRLDASRYNPAAAKLAKHLAAKGAGLEALSSVGYDAWVPGRYKRIHANDGVTFLDSSDLFEINPDADKRYADCRFGDQHRGRVKPGWILMACSGQVYGIIGGAILATPFFEEKVVANHVIRIVPRKDSAARAGYILTALTHPSLGRPLVKALAFGSRVPEISPEDIAKTIIVRLPQDDEQHIADLAEKAADLRAKADILENEIAVKADRILTRFMAGDSIDADAH